MTHSRRAGCLDAEGHTRFRGSANENLLLYFSRLTFQGVNQVLMGNGMLCNASLAGWKRFLNISKFVKRELGAG